MDESAGSLQQEIQQTRPFASRREEALLGILRTADLLRRQISRSFEPYGLTGQQYNVLRILRGAGKEGLPTLEIARRMIEDAPGITRFIDRLEAQRLIRRERCVHDRRQVFCLITEEGMALLAKIDSSMADWNDQKLLPLSEEEIATLISLLDRVRNKD